MILVVVFFPRILTRLLPVLLRHPVLVMVLRVVPPILLLQRRLRLLGVVVIVVEPEPVPPAFRRDPRVRPPSPRHRLHR